MKSNIFKSKRICKNTWVINGSGSPSYLLVGNNRGLVINTGYADGNIRAYAQTLTNKSVDIAANTHVDFNNTGGNGYFEQVYMSAKSLEHATKYTLDYTVVIIGDGDKIDLGGRIIEVIENSPHVANHVVFLDRKRKFLLTGDTGQPIIYL